MEKNRTTIESVLCRLEAKEVQGAADRFEQLHDAMMEGLKMQMDISNGQLHRMKQPLMSLRDYGLLLTRIGLSAIAASEDEDNQEEDEDDEDA